MKDKCVLCGNTIGNDDIGITKKLINRGAEEFLCIACLAKRFSVTTEQIQEKIKEFKEQGCSLFAVDQEEIACRNTE